MSLLWRVAREALLRAERLVVWGYSCPTTDYHVAWLLRGSRASKNQGHMREVHVVDPDHDKVKGRLMMLLGPDLVFKTFGSHDEYLGDAPHA